MSKSVKTTLFELGVLKRAKNGTTVFQDSTKKFGYSPVPKKADPVALVNKTCENFDLKNISDLYIFYKKLDLLAPNFNGYGWVYGDILDEKKQLSWARSVIFALDQLVIIHPKEALKNSFSFLDRVDELKKFYGSIGYLKKSNSYWLFNTKSGLQKNCSLLYTLNSLIESFPEEELAKLCNGYLPKDIPELVKKWKSLGLLKYDLNFGWWKFFIDGKNWKQFDNPFEALNLLNQSIKLDDLLKKKAAWENIGYLEDGVVEVEPVNENNSDLTNFGSTVLVKKSYGFSVYSRDHWINHYGSIVTAIAILERNCSEMVPYKKQVEFELKPEKQVVEAIQ